MSFKSFIYACGLQHSHPYCRVTHANLSSSAGLALLMYMEGRAFSKLLSSTLCNKGARRTVTERYSSHNRAQGITCHIRKDVELKISAIFASKYLIKRQCNIRLFSPQIYSKGCTTLVVYSNMPYIALYTCQRIISLTYVKFVAGVGVPVNKTYI